MDASRARPSSTERPRPAGSSWRSRPSRSWRRGWDSNPRGAKALRFSRPLRSTTPAPLRGALPEDTGPPSRPRGSGCGPGRLGVVPPRRVAAGRGRLGASQPAGAASAPPVAAGAAWHRRPQSPWPWRPELRPPTRRADRTAGARSAEGAQPGSRPRAALRLLPAPQCRCPDPSSRGACPACVRHAADRAPGGRSGHESLPRAASARHRGVCGPSSPLGRGRDVAE